MSEHEKIFKINSALTLIIAVLTSIGAAAWITREIVSKKEMPSEIFYKKMLTLQVTGNGGLIDIYEYRTRGIICVIEVLAVPRPDQTYSNVQVDCVKD